MDLTMLTCLVVGSSFALYIGIAFWSRAQDTRDFYVAGKHVHPIANGMPTVCQRYANGMAADWMSAASFISMAGLIAFLGYDGRFASCDLGFRLT
jgi:cation/acetate symporter